MEDGHRGVGVALSIASREELPHLLGVIGLQLLSLMARKIDVLSMFAESALRAAMTWSSIRSGQVFASPE